jgi:glycosyltransferase involved in cell wall biosynthesis
VAEPGRVSLTVAICTRDRPEGLARLLASLDLQSDSDFSIVVVDNAPRQPDAVPQVLEATGRARCTYVREDAPGLSRARNAALAVIESEVVAWIDDDELADGEWVRRVKQGFAHPSAPSALGGLMLPAELESEAQVRFEQYGGFNKGRGFAPEVLRAGTASVASPLYPLPSFGPGGNMAFLVEPLRRLGGFDARLGAGTPTYGGEETQALASLLRRGDVVLHWPAAVTWHFHRREMAALEKQMFGYSAGLSAFLASMVRRDPSAAVEIARLVPHAVRDMFGRDSQLSGHLPADFPRALTRAARRGLVEGAFRYVVGPMRTPR